MCIQALAAALATIISTITVLSMGLVGKLHSGDWTQWMIAFAVSFVLSYAPGYITLRDISRNNPEILKS